MSRQLPIYILSLYVLAFAGLSVYPNIGMTLWPWITLIAQVLLVLGVIGYHTSKYLRSLITKNATLLCFVVTLTATTGSLFYSEIAGLTPCKLCWFQRVFMYPLPLLFGLGHWKGENILTYTRWMAGLGGSIAGYHYLSQFFIIATSCTGAGPECSTKLVFHLGYITIPLMAFTAFIIVLLVPREN